MKAIQENTIKVAVFFDGTGNNKVNVNLDLTKSVNQTNIARLYEACNIDHRVYIEGVGTVDQEEDSAYAKATGNNPLGYSGYSYTDKLDKAMAYFRTLEQENKQKSFEFYVFGFSRGACLARDFTKTILTNSKVKIAYLGLIDTVVTLLTHQVSIYFTPSELDRIDQILHLCAINECRNFFPLTSLQTSDTRTLPLTVENYYTNKVKEIYVPGAHADLGGGYVSGPENNYLNMIRDSQEDLIDSLNLIKTSVKDNLSCVVSQPIWEALMGSNVSVKAYTTEFNLVSERDLVTIDLALTYFETLVMIVNDFCMETIFTNQSVVTDSSLIQLRDAVFNYVKSNVPEKGPCYDYHLFAAFTHLSANYGKEGESNNDWLNTFNPEQLEMEISAINSVNSDFGNEMYDLSSILVSFDLVSSYINAPANEQWFREVKYENS